MLTAAIGRPRALPEPCRRPCPLAAPAHVPVVVSLPSGRSFAASLGVAAAARSTDARRPARRRPGAAVPGATAPLTLKVPSFSVTPERGRAAGGGLGRGGTPGKASSGMGASGGANAASGTPTPRRRHADKLRNQCVAVSLKDRAARAAFTVEAETYPGDNGRVQPLIRLGAGSETRMSEQRQPRDG